MPKLRCRDYKETTMKNENGGNASQTSPGLSWERTVFAFAHAQSDRKAMHLLSIKVATSSCFREMENI